MSRETCVLVCAGSALRHPLLRATLADDLSRLRRSGMDWIVLCAAPTWFAENAAASERAGLADDLRRRLDGVVEMSVDEVLHPAGERRLRECMARGATPVVRALAAGPGGRRDPVNADSLGDHVARHLRADRLFILADDAATPVPGGAAGTHLTDRAVLSALGAARGPGVAATHWHTAARCVGAGVRVAHLLDARRSHVLRREMLGAGGCGVTVVSHGSDRFARDCRRYFAA